MLPSRISVVGSVSQFSSLKELDRLAVPDLTDVVELRLDCYPQLQVNALPKLNLPLLVTARCPAEGGNNTLTADERSALLRPFLAVASLVDVEISSLESMAMVVDEIRTSGVGLVTSFHDFEGTPPLEKLVELMKVGRLAGAQIVKFATTLRGPEDVAVLVSLLGIEDRPPLSVMGMGDLGKVSRLLFARLGSVLNYGYLDAPTVPGQWEARRLKSLLEEINAA